MEKVQAGNRTRVLTIKLQGSTTEFLGQYSTSHLSLTYVEKAETAAQDENAIISTEILWQI